MDNPQLLAVPTPPAFKPSDLTGLVGWIETEADGTLVNQLERVTGLPQTLLVFPDADNPERGILLLFNRKLTAAEREIMSHYGTKETVQVTPS